MNIIAKILRGGSKTLNYLFVGVFALAASGAWAGTFNWTGTVDSFWNKTDNWAKSDDYGSRTLPTDDDMVFDSKYFNDRFKENEVVFDGAYANDYRAYINNVGTPENPLVFRATDASSGLQFANSKHTYFANSSAAYLKLASGKWSSGARNFEIGASSAPGWLIVTDGAELTVGNHFFVKNGKLILENGTVDIPNNERYLALGASADGCALVLGEGGVLKTKLIWDSNGGCASTVVFNGGTLKANGVYSSGWPAIIADMKNISVKVCAKGGTIDSSGFDIQVARPIAPDGSSTGGMTFKGGGKVTLTAQPTYTGLTTVEVGTTLVIPRAIAGEKLAFTIPAELADGIYTVVSISGNSCFAGDVLLGKAEEFVLSSDKKRIYYVKGIDTKKPVYIGTDGNLSAAENWLGGTVPTSGTGDAQISCALASTFTVGDTFAPAKLVILDGSAIVTIGSGTLHVSEVENRKLLVVGEGATVVIGNQLTLAEGESLCDQNNGTLVVSNLLLTAESGDRYVTANQIASKSGVFKFNAVTNSMTAKWFYLTDRNAAVPYEFYIGVGGLCFSNASGTDTWTSAYCIGRDYDDDNSVTTIRPWYSDFTIEDRGTGMRSLILMHEITFCTDDESGVGRTITIDAKTRGERSPVITVSGKGRLQVNGTCENAAEPIVTVTDTATLAFGAGASLGAGTITLGNDTKLVLTQPADSNMFTPIANVIKLPTPGVATIRIDGARLKTGVHEIAIVDAEAGSSANVMVDKNSATLNGRKATLTVNDGGKLILNIMSNGTRIIVR